MSETLSIDMARGAMPSLLEALERVVRMETPTSDVESAMDAVRLLEGMVSAELGEETERVSADGRPHLVARFGSGPRRVLLLCHVDTVWPHGSIETHPWSVVDGVIRGPGCFDMKTGLVQAIYALKLLQRAGESIDGATLLVTTDEEVGSPTSRDVIEAEAAACACVFVLEAAGPGGALKTERKGVSRYTVRVSGRASHAGLEPERGVNAGLELAHQIPLISALGDPAVGTTVTPTTLVGGTTTNTVPAAASVDVDVRVRTVAEQHRVDREIRELRAVLDGARVVVEGGANRPPFEERSSAALFDRARKLAARHALPDLAECSVGGASDGNFTAGMGVPTLDGLGAVGGGAHADSEHAQVEAIPGRVLLLALLIRDVLGRR